MSSVFSHIAKTSTRQALIEYPKVEGVRFRVRLLTDHERLRIEDENARAVREKFGDEKPSAQEQLEAMWGQTAQSLVRAGAIVDWEIPVAAVPRLAEIPAEALPTEPPPFDIEGCINLLSSNWDLYTFVRDAIKERAIFIAAEEATLKKIASPTSDKDSS